MKQTASVNECAVCAVGPIIGNDEVGSSILPRGTSKYWPPRKSSLSKTPHNAAIGGTNRDLHT